MGAGSRRSISVSLVRGGHSETLAASLAAGHERLDVRQVDPQSAIDAAADRTTDCVVSGQDIAGTTGVALLESVRENRSDLPVFLYPASPVPAVASRAVAADVTEYLPAGSDGVSPGQLASRIVAAVDEARRDRSRAESRARYQRMLDTVGDLVYTLDADGHFTFINEAGARMTGYDRDELVGSHVSLVLDEVAVESGRDLIGQLLTTEDMQRGTVEMDLLTADGERIPCENHIALLPERDGEFVGTVGVMRDISERKRREEALEALHDATRDMMAAESPESVATIASRTATDVLDMPLNSVLLYDEEADALRSAASSPLTDDLFGSPIEFERDEGIVWNAYEHGETRVFSDVSASPDVYNPDTVARSEFILPLGDHGAMIVGSRTVSDFEESDVALAKVLAANLQAALTAAKREQTLRERERQLERQNERLEEFASVVSHDLRNPLNVAQGRLELFAETGQQAHYEKVESAHERMGEIIDEVLALAREGRTVRELEPVDVAALADAAWSNIAADDATLDATGAPVVRGDPNRVQQLLGNLFRNAVEHGTVDRTDRVTIRVGPLTEVGADDPGFYVADDGPGVPVADRDEVFDSGFSTSEDGSGFGLAIVEQIATAHGWEIALAESWAGGARFEIRGVQDA